MRILHFSDVHIGVENYGRVDPETGLSTRLGDFLASFDEVVTYAIDNRVDLALFSGDAYKSRDPSQTHQREFARRVARMANAGVPVFLLVGNHDMPYVVGRATALEIFDTLEVQNVHIGDSLRIHVVQTPSGPLQVVAVPWVRRSAFLARDEARGLSPEQVNEAIQERLTRAIRYQADNLDAAVPAVLAGHVTVSQAVAGSEQSMMLGRDHVLLNSGVALPEFDYVALGHIHKHQVLGHSPMMAYAGSLERVDFGEERDDKGFCVVELDPSQPPGSRFQGFSFEQVNARTFLTVSVEISPGDLDPTATVLHAISRHHIEGAIVKLRMALPVGLEAHLRDSEIRQALEGAFYVASISKEVVERRRPRLGSAYAKGLDPRDALRIYLEGREVAPDRVEALMRRAEELIAEHPLQ